MLSPNRKGTTPIPPNFSISMNGKVEDKTLFVLELTYAAFAEVNVPAEHLEPVLMIELPRLIFPVCPQCGYPMPDRRRFAAVYAESDRFRGIVRGASAGG